MGRTAQHPLYRMVYILAKAHGAVDWFNGVPVCTENLIRVDDALESPKLAE
jgi:hypothetical protein